MLKKYQKVFQKTHLMFFCELYEKFVMDETARRKYLEFCKYFEVLEICKILPTILHGKGEVGLSSSSEYCDKF